MGLTSRKSKPSKYRSSIITNMKTQTKNQTWTDVKKQIKEFSHDGLIDLVKRLCEKRRAESRLEKNAI